MMFRRTMDVKSFGDQRPVMHRRQGCDPNLPEETAVILEDKR